MKAVNRAGTALEQVRERVFSGPSLLEVSGTALARLIRDRLVTSREIVEAHIARIQSVNPALNAVVAERFEAARHEADRADRTVAECDPKSLPPFHGVPCTIKEAFAVEGMPNTSGLLWRRSLTVGAGDEGAAVKRLKASGAIPLGVTNTSEICLWIESFNRVYGRTSNPYDHTRTVGGSSGGEGAIIGAGGSPFGLGADVGGSIRMPAFFNGIFGHKPSGGLVPGTGQYPRTTGKSGAYLATGPMTRRAADLWPLVSILRGPDGVDGSCVPFDLGDPAAVDLAGLTVLLVEDNGLIPVRTEVVDALHRAAHALEARGARVVRRRFEKLWWSLDIWGAMLATGGAPSVKRLMTGGAPARIVRELFSWLFGRSAHTLPALILGLVEDIPAMTPRRTATYARMGEELKGEIEDALGPSGVMLYPPFPHPAPLHGRPLLRPLDFTYCGIINVLELPATQVPLGMSSTGVPLGVQVIARRGADAVTIRVAQELEAAFGGWSPPQVIT